MIRPGFRIIRADDILFYNCEDGINVCLTAMYSYTKFFESLLTNPLIFQGGAQQPQVPQEDFEREISGGRVVPKPLPLVTPSPAVSPAPGVMRQQHAARKDTVDQFCFFSSIIES